MAIKIVVGRTPKDLAKTTDAIVDFLHKIADRIDCNDTWVLDILKQTKSSLRFSVRHFDKDVVNIRVMPGDSSTCWECCLRPKSCEAFMLGRELSLWNGFDGFNVPAAVKANTEEFADTDPLPSIPVTEEVSILDRLSSAEKIAKRYRERKAAIVAGENRVLAAMAEVESLQKQVDELRAQHEADSQGQAACEAIDAVSRLFSM